MKMKPELKTAWVGALRSGEYKQGTGALRRVGQTGDEPSFCCLGVLCEIAGVKKGADYDNDTWYGQPGNSGFPSDNLRSRRFGMTYAEMRQFADMNDMAHLTFDQIADKIEEMA